MLQKEKKKECFGVQTLTSCRIRVIIHACSKCIVSYIYTGLFSKRKFGTGRNRTLKHELHHSSTLLLLAMQVWLGALVIIVLYEHMQETFLGLLLNYSNIYNAI